MPLFFLTHDGALHLHAPHDLLPLLKRWLPLHAVERDVPASGIRIDVVHAGAVQLPADLAAPTLRMGDTVCIVDGDVAWISGPGTAAFIDLAGGRATVQLDAAAGSMDTIAPLSMTTALLLARARRYLLHCAAVHHPAHGALLLAGDSRSGKTSTSLNLVRAGWSLLADDHVVLREVDGGWEVEGWPRVMHPDEGWLRGEVTGRRINVDPRDVAELRLHPPARLAGILLPRVSPDSHVTTMAPASHAAALAMVMRQGAWSVADRAVAAAALADLAAATGVPAYAIELARDTFADPPALARIVSSALST